MARSHPRTILRSLSLARQGKWKEKRESRKHENELNLIILANTGRYLPLNNNFISYFDVNGKALCCKQATLSTNFNYWPSELRTEVAHCRDSAIVLRLFITHRCNEHQQPLLLLNLPFINFNLFSLFSLPSERN